MKLTVDRGYALYLESKQLRSKRIKIDDKRSHNEPFIKRPCEEYTLLACQNCAIMLLTSNI